MVAFLENPAAADFWGMMTCCGCGGCFVKRIFRRGDVEWGVNDNEGGGVDEDDLENIELKNLNHYFKSTRQIMTITRFFNINLSLNLDSFYVT
jgi:hypothetical protein